MPTSRLKPAKCRRDRSTLPKAAITWRHHVVELDISLAQGESTARIVQIGGIMRVIQAIILLAFLGAIGLFAVQNTEAITVTFWTWKATAPVALLAIGVYLLGMVSGGTVVSFFRRSLHRVSERSAG
jgi:putative membrane protein